MTREEAIKWFRNIVSGMGVDRTKFPDNMKGRIAKTNWDEPMFSIGIEYGVLFALLEIYDITSDELIG